MTPGGSPEERQTKALERIATALERIAGLMVDDAAERANEKQVTKQAAAKAEERRKQAEEHNRLANSAAAQLGPGDVLDQNGEFR